MRHFCLETECEGVRKWFTDQGYTRPDDFEKRLDLAVRLKDEGNKQFQESAFESAMMHALAALHCIDFSQARSILQDVDQKRRVNEALLPLLSNLSLVFQKRGDAYNSARAADLGLDFAKRLPASSSDKMKPKLLFRRAIAKGQRRDFDDALSNLREAARLCPTDAMIRKALENCKLAVQQERGAPDDRWRGLLTDSPEKARQHAQKERRWRDWKATGREVFRSFWQHDRLKLIAVLVMAPVIAVGGRLLAPHMASYGGGIAS